MNPYTEHFNYSANRVSATSQSGNEFNANQVKRIIILGGGTAGWMTANTFARAFADKNILITVVESPTVDIIGVGEGSTPALKGFFDDLGIEESEWMPACNATYKCGITFENWSTRPGFESYFHPFASMLDNMSLRMFIFNTKMRVGGADVYAHPDRFFISSLLAKKNLAPKPSANFPFDVWYGYHFDSVLLGKFLHKKALQRGVIYKSAHIADVNLSDNGDIASILTKEGETIAADFFVDCTGFAGILIDKALKTPFVSYSNNLFNDAAIAMPTDIGEGIPSETVSTALKYGWAWKIPLTNRYGNGYVYSSSHCSADQAEFELRQRLGQLDSDTPARHLRMKIGRVTKHWHRNCLAVGLSQGFIEPLEATALFFVQLTASSFADYFIEGDLGEKAQAKYNSYLNARFEGTRDYIVTHYKTNSRTDTDYWRENTDNPNISSSLQSIYAQWMSGKGLAPDASISYPSFSWYCILAGMGIFPDKKDLRLPNKRESQINLDQIDDFINRSASNFHDHRKVLNNIPPKYDKPSLQYWIGQEL